MSPVKIKTPWSTLTQESNCNSNGRQPRGRPVPVSSRHGRGQLPVRSRDPQQGIRRADRHSAAGQRSTRELRISPRTTQDRPSLWRRGWVSNHPWYHPGRNSHSGWFSSMHCMALSRYAQVGAFRVNRAERYLRAFRLVGKPDQVSGRSVCRDLEPPHDWKHEIIRPEFSARGGVR